MEPYNFVSASHDIHRLIGALPLGYMHGIHADPVKVITIYNWPWIKFSISLSRSSALYLIKFTIYKQILVNYACILSLLINFLL